MSQRKEKEAVLRHLTEAIKAAGYCMEGMTLSEDESIVEVNFSSGNIVPVNVAYDSPEALLRDVVRATVLK